MSPRSTRRRSIAAVRNVLAAGALLMISGYLLLDRNHAEELSGGFRVSLDVLRGERQLSPVTWVALAASLYFCVRVSRHQQRV